MQLGKPLIAAAILLIGCASVASNEAVPVQGAQMKLSSSQMKAVIVAYNDFAKTIGAQTDGPPELVAHVSNVDNYSVSVSENATQYVVEFLPNPLKGQPLKGGGARYTVGKGSSQIENVVRLK
jgi:hypothetical protein